MCISPDSGRSNKKSSLILVYFKKKDFLCRNIALNIMEVKEPAVAYGINNDRLEEVKSQIISVIQDITDIQVLDLCYKILQKNNSYTSEKSIGDYNGISEKVRGLIGVAGKIPAEDIANDDRLSYLLSLNNSY